jgi:hypothetical protein
LRRNELRGTRLRRAAEAVLIVAVGYGTAAVLGVGLGKLAVANQAAFDAPAYAWLSQFKEPGSAYAELMEFLTAFGDPMPSVAQAAILTLVFMGLFGRQWWLPLLVLPIALILELSLQNLVGAIVRRESPPSGGGTWFSGASARFIIIYGLSVFLLVTRWPWISRRWRVVGIAAVVLLVLGIGYTRLYLAHHWPTDIPAGWLMGTLILLAVILAARRLTLRTEETPESPSIEARDQALSGL